MERGASSDLFKGHDNTQKCHDLTPPSADVLPLTDEAITRHDCILEFSGKMMDTVTDVEMRVSCDPNSDMYLMVS